VKAMSETKSIHTMDIFSHMVKVDDHEFKLAPLSNVIEARLVKHGTKLTIGVGENIVGKILNGQLVGGFIYCDKEHFEQVKKQLAAQG
jgi:hypothetical protein